MMMRVALLTLFLFLSIFSFGQDRRHAISAHYGASASRIWSDANPGRGKQQNIFANAAFIEYRIVSWKPFLQFHVGVNYLERGLRFRRERANGSVSITRETFSFLGAKTSASISVRQFNAEVGLLIQNTLSWKLARDGTIMSTDVDYYPQITASTFFAAGYDFKLKPKVDFCAKAFMSNSPFFNKWNYGVSIGLQYQFGKEITSIYSSEE